MRKVISSKGTYSGCTTLVAFDKIIEKAFQRLPQIRVTKDYSWIYETDKQWIRVTTGKGSSTSIILTIEVLSKGKFDQEANRALLGLIFKTINETCEKLDFPLTPSGRARSVKPLNTFVEEPVIYEEYSEDHQDEENSRGEHRAVHNIIINIVPGVIMGFFWYYVCNSTEVFLYTLFFCLALYLITVLIKIFVKNKPKWLIFWTEDNSSILIGLSMAVILWMFFPKEESDSNFSWPFAQEETSFPDKPIVTFDPVKDAKMYKRYFDHNYDAAQEYTELVIYGYYRRFEPEECTRLLQQYMDIIIKYSEEEVQKEWNEIYQP